MKKMLSCLLVFALLVAMVPMGAVAVSAATSGTTGDCTWTLDDNGRLTISGTGAMGNYTREYNNGAYRTTAPWGWEITSVTIEDGVTTIGNCAFFHCAALTNVTIEDGVTSIGDSAFYNCTSLTSITIGNDVKAIGSLAFYFCTSLKSIDIPKNLTTIGFRAFKGCESLANIIIPDTVTSIGEEAFHSTAYYNNEANWENGALYINNHLIVANTHTSVYEIKLGTITIAANAFENASSRTVKIPISITNIGDWAFYNCDSLTNIIIPDSVTNIGNEAFAYCDNLYNIVIPDSVISIGRFAFDYCTYLTSVTIPNSVKCIDEFAFNGCDALKDVYISDVATWCNIDFKSSSSNPLSYASNLYLNNKLITDITIPNGVTKIPEGAFKGCTSFKSLIISNSVTHIESDAFADCTGLKSVKIGNSVKSIGEKAFSNCDSLICISFPNSVINIGYMAFNSCNSLENVMISSGLTGIEEYAFYYCISLANITIPKSVTNIGDWAFYNCKSLKNVWYLGSYQDKLKIEIGENNTNLINCEWRYNSCINSATHTFDNLCDATCNICGHIREVEEHSCYWHHIDSMGEDAYDLMCEKCNRNFGRAYSVDEMQYYMYAGEIDGEHSHNIYNYEGVLVEQEKCVVEKWYDWDDYHEGICSCHAILEEATHDYAPATCQEPKRCTICSAINGSALGHTYTNSCDTTCNRCQEIRVTNHIYTDTCDRECNICFATRIAPHDYAYVCDDECDTCGFLRKVTHEYSDATCTAPKSCVVCGITTGEAMGHSFDNMCDGLCDACGFVREIDGHTYDDPCDVDCNECGAIREIDFPITFGGNSTHEDVSGLAFRFDVAVQGMEKENFTAIYNNATVDGFKLLNMGAIVTNGFETKDIPAVYLCGLKEATASFTVRIIDIPAFAYDIDVTATPYIILEIDGVATTIYGEAQTCSYNEALG